MDHVVLGASRIERLTPAEPARDGASVVAEPELDLRLPSGLCHHLGAVGIGRGFVLQTEDQTVQHV